MAEQKLESLHQHQPLFRNRDRGRSDVPDTPELERVQRWLLRLYVEHLHGPEQVEAGNEELVVLCLLRNGRHHVASFVEHYLSLGAKHLVFLDNGSTDGTPDLLRGYENVTVLRTELPFRRYQLLMKQYLIERFGWRRWSLCADVDELFDYPYSDVLGLDAFLGYLNERSYTAVVAQMLDMFPEQPLSEAAETTDKGLKELHRFYDTSDIRTHDYNASGAGTGNVLANEEIDVLQGGIQRLIFGISPMLTKHPLVFYEGTLRPMDMSEHWVSEARIADVSCVLYHYKLLGSLYGLVRDEVDSRRYPNRHGKYDKYLKVLESAPSLELKRETARELGSVNELVGNQFLVASRGYLEFVEREETRDGAPPERHRQRLLEAFLQAGTEARSQRRRTTELQERIQRLENELYRERGRADQLRYRNENLEKKNRNMREWNANLRESLDLAQSNLKPIRAALDRLRKVKARLWSGKP